MSFQDNQEQDGIFDINVTPFVDVLLVLLVIFMVTTPIMVQQSLKINLPNSKSVDSVDPSTLSVTISSQGQYFINGKLSTVEEIADVAKECLAKIQRLRLYLPPIWNPNTSMLWKSWIASVRPESLNSPSRY
jgi:biopolymer transport protein ExbD